ncbi:MAG: sodium transporter, partial [Planctomycetes bacterium]|nr:sodium transporter [Planctomycetota bacterium]
MKKSLVSMVIALCLAPMVIAAEALQWDELPPLPPAPGQASQLGLAGAFSGVDQDALIVAGGANFPDGLPWTTLADGSSPKKIYNRDIYVLRKTGDAYEWKISDVKLPHGTSYGVSIPTDDGLLCIGGEWREYGAEGAKSFKSDRLFVIKHLGDGQVKMSESYRGKALPSLPDPVSSMAGAMVGHTIYIAGGSNGKEETKTCLSLNLTEDRLAWVTEASWPGPPRSHLMAAVASDGFRDCFYIFSGRYKDPDTGWQCLTDTWKFDGTLWTRGADVGTNLHSKDATCVMAGTSVKIGANHIAVFGGASGELFKRLDQTMPAQAERLRQEGKEAEADAVTAERWRLYTDHPGFSRDILAYHTVTDSWYPMGTLPESEINGITAGSHVTTNAVKWGSHVVIPSGEVRPGVRSPRVWRARPRINSRFGTVNYTVLGAYLGALVLMGFYFSKRENSTDDFFKAGGRVPWWAAGLSIFGTQLSAITFMAIPAKSFSTDWRWCIMNMTIIMVAPFVVFLFLPFYRRLHITTAYEYIEKRFNLPTRLFASGMFIVFQLARIGIVLYLPSIALSVVTGVSIEVCITVMALLSIAYTVMGGIEAVIWTDVIQVIVLLGGALLVLCLIPFSLKGGWNSMVDLAESADKLRALDFHFRWKSATFWVLIFGGGGGSFYGYACDQAVIQRYLTTKSEKDAAKGIWAGAIMAIPATLIFFGIGTALFA